ncbi:short chain dehydrogenase [Nocardioides dokdonensis FR1436]|uniref:Short chain dehydrogenase n=1 Tax=Nocardioides dokdonensis FR1436 TaxID=1300347 RepID=A0A1A9GFQ2_9ACTN|nr:SDR family oxidoreductase [Nocardioides dokdonensis]ANH36520.1 short chain dehydrogenase [Nocardioides dokdonensis FR1436]
MDIQPSTQSGAQVVVVVGAGPGVSGSLARRCAAEGWQVGLVGLDEHALADLAATLVPARVERRIADLTDPVAGAQAVAGLGERFGRIDLLHVNPSAYREADPLHLGVEELLEDVRLGVGSLLTAVQAAHPYLVRGARVTVTGSMAADQPSPVAASLGVQKAGVRNLVHSLDATLAPEGVRAVSVTVRGALAREGTFSHDAVAAAILDASRQDEADWRSEVSYPSV